MNLSTPAGTEAQRQASTDFAKQKTVEQRDRLHAKIAYKLDITVAELLQVIGAKD